MSGCLPSLFVFLFLFSVKASTSRTSDRERISVPYLYTWREIANCRRSHAAHGSLEKVVRVRARRYLWTVCFQLTNYFEPIRLASHFNRSNGRGNVKYAEIPLHGVLIHTLGATTTVSGRRSAPILRYWVRLTAHLSHMFWLVRLDISDVDMEPGWTEAKKRSHSVDTTLFFPPFLRTTTDEEPRPMENLYWTNPTPDSTPSPSLGEGTVSVATPDGTRSDAGASGEPDSPAN